MIRDALPAEAVRDDSFTARFGPNVEVWHTDQWQYLVKAGTREVLNVVKKSQPTFPKHGVDRYGHPKKRAP